MPVKKRKASSKARATKRHVRKTGRKAKSTLNSKATRTRRKKAGKRHTTLPAATPQTVVEIIETEIFEEPVAVIEGETEEFLA